MLNRIYWWIVEIKKPVYRCLACECLLCESGIRTGEHVGHKIKIAINVSFMEWLMLKVGLIR